MEIKEEKKERFVYAMFGLMQMMKKRMGECCTKSGNIGDKEFIIINFVGKHHHVKMSDISENMSVPMSTLTSIVDRLVDRKYLTRYHSNEDRRVVLVTLGTKGKEAYETFMTQNQDLADAVLSEFNVSDQDKLIEFLQKNAWNNRKNKKTCIINFEYRNIAQSVLMNGLIGLFFCA
ncbi:MAG: winged helix-turn-helix transcriptional regulator [Flavobacteriales bacterium]|nr:winged helix-turn-helix transcriptional regulator [Flavobacteriales bacterium]